MVRAALTTTLAATLFAAGLAPVASAQERVGLSATVAECQTAVDRAGRRATFNGSMPAEPGATVLGMRFSLQQRASAGDAWTRVRGLDDFGDYQRSSADAPGFVYDKAVRGLDAARQYRALVRFAWFDEDGRIVRRATRRSPVCKQPDLRPDLHVEDLRLVDAGEGQAEYVVFVRNEGRTSVRDAFDVDLRIGGQAVGTQTLPSLGVLGLRTLVFRAPRCASGQPIEAIVSPAAGAPERDRADNRSSRPCP